MVEGSFSDVVTVQKSSYDFLDEKLPYELVFYNNQGRDLSLYTDREFGRTQKNQIWAFKVKGVVTFFWRSGTLMLEYIVQECFTENLLKYWVLHIALPIFFAIEEIYDFRHAGAVEIDGKPILFVAESFGGKSTLTDFFMKQGHKMISDDKVATFEKEGVYYSIASHPYHRPYRKMEDLGFIVENISTQVKPIHVIYELQRSEPSVNIEIIEQRGFEKFEALYKSNTLDVYFLKQNRFNYLMRMANSVRIFKVIVPWDISRLTDVYNSIVNHSNSIEYEEK